MLTFAHMPNSVQFLGLVQLFFSSMVSALRAIWLFFVSVRNSATRTLDMVGAGNICLRTCSLAVSFEFTVSNVSCVSQTLMRSMTTCSGALQCLTANCVKFLGGETPRLFNLSPQQRIFLAMFCPTRSVRRWTGAPPCGKVFSSLRRFQTTHCLGSH